MFLLSDILYLIAYHLVGYRRKVVRRNLAAAFPERDEKERLKIERRYYRHLCDLLIEGLYNLFASPRSIMKRYHVVSELLDGVMLFDLLNGKVCDRNGNEVAFAKELYTQYQNDKFNFAIFLVKNILSGLMALHDKGYIHRIGSKQEPRWEILK